jgi:hypothetical protein
MNRLGDIAEREIDENVIRNVPKNTEKSKNSVWRQFMSFCAEKSSHLIERLQYWFQIHILHFYSRNILPEYHLCLKINQIISIQALVLRTRHKLS